MKAGTNRDQELGRLLERTLAARTDSVPPTACPGAEMLAVWVDGSLPAAERSATEAHIADCARCQTLLATMARMPALSPTTSGWSVGRVLAWVVPLTAGAAAVALWIAVHPRALVSVGPRMPVSTESPTPAARTPEEHGSTAAPRLGQTAEQRQANPPASHRDVTTRLGSRDLAARKQERESEPVPPAATAAPAAAAPAPAARPLAESTPAAEDSTRNAAPAAKPSELAGGARAERAKSANTVSTASAKIAADLSTVSAAVVEIATSDRSVRWRITGGRLVERSTDGGMTWEKQIESTTQVTAGGSPAPSICWLVGRAALVLVSVDGHSWRRVVFPETVDLTGIRAVDAATASVTTADGRTFTTRDGGSTWVATPLQESSAAPF